MANIGGYAADKVLRPNLSLPRCAAMLLFLAGQFAALNRVYGRPVRIGVDQAAPYQSEYAIIWRGSGPGSHDPEPAWKGRTVAITNLPFVVRLVTQSLPGSVLDLTPNRTVTIEHLCSGRANGAVMEVRLLEAMLLDRPSEGAAISFRVRALSEL